MCITIKSLTDVPYCVITECFNQAFADYSFSMSFTEEQLRTILTRSGFHKDFSAGAFDGDRMVGFILNAHEIYGDRPVVFDIGTAIVPEYRGQGVFSKLFAYVVDTLGPLGVKTFALEVLQENEPAIAIYQKRGYRIAREFVVLSGEKQDALPTDAVIHQCPLSEFEFPAYGVCAMPSFENSIHVLKKNVEMYRVAFTKSGDGVTAFCVFCPRNGAAAEYGYSDMDSLRSIFAHLLQNQKRVSVKNLDLRCDAVLQMLTGLGFREMTRQYEMILEI